MSALHSLSQTFVHRQPAAAAALLEASPPDSVAAWLSTLKTKDLAALLGHFSPHFAAACLDSMPVTRSAKALGLSGQDEQVAVLRQMSAVGRDRLLQALPPETGARLQRLLPYQGGSAGALMEAAPTTVPESMPVKDALKRVSKNRKGIKFYVYITDKNNVLIGAATLHRLLNAESSMIVGELARRPAVTLRHDQSLHSVVNDYHWEEFQALPVVDEHGVLLGVIRLTSLRSHTTASEQLAALRDGVDTAMRIGRLFSMTAGHLLSAVLSTGAEAARGRFR